MGFRHRHQQVLLARCRFTGKSARNPLVDFLESSPLAIISVGFRHDRVVVSGLEGLIEFGVRAFGFDLCHCPMGDPNPLVSGEILDAAYGFLNFSDAHILIFIFNRLFTKQLDLETVADSFPSQEKYTHVGSYCERAFRS